MECYNPTFNKHAFCKNAKGTNLKATKGGFDCLNSLAFLQDACLNTGLCFQNS